MNIIELHREFSKRFPYVPPAKIPERVCGQADYSESEKGMGACGCTAPGVEKSGDHVDIFLSGTPAGMKIKLNFLFYLIRKCGLQASYMTKLLVKLVLRKSDNENK